MAEYSQLTPEIRYRRERKIGEEGTAIIYCGTDTVLNRPVTIKLLREKYNAAMLERFRSQTSSIARLNHPNIISIYDVGDQHGQPFIVMEYVNGENLQQLMQREGALAPARAIDLITQVLAGLAYAHNQGLVHHNIKPSNILVNTAGHVKLADFNIVANNDVLQFGAVEYISPEQALHEPVTPASDLYSVGVLLFEMLTGRPPFLADTPMAVATKHVNTAAPVASTFNPRVPRSMNAVLLRALAKRPLHRYQNAELMRQSLLAVANDSTSTTTALPTTLAGATGNATVAVATRRLTPATEIRRGSSSSIPIAIAALALVLFTAWIANTLSNVTFSLAPAPRPTRTPTGVRTVTVALIGGLFELSPTPLATATEWLSDVVASPVTTPIENSTILATPVVSATQLAIQASTPTNNVAIAAPTASAGLPVNLTPSITASALRPGATPSGSVTATETLTQVVSGIVTPGVPPNLVSPVSPTLVSTASYAIQSNQAAYLTENAPYNEVYIRVVEVNGAPSYGVRTRIRAPDGWTITLPESGVASNRAEFKFVVIPGTYTVTLEDASGHTLSEEATRTFDRPGNRGFWRWVITFVKQ